MVITKLSISGLILIIIGLVIVIVHALNMGFLSGVDYLLPELGIILVGIAVQLLGLGVVIVDRKSN